MLKITDESVFAKSWHEQAQKQTVGTLMGFVNHLMNDYEHDYNTVCHAVAACALAAIHAADNTEQGGITGFQAGFIMWEIVREMCYKSNKTGLRIQDFDNMLFPQYQDRFDKTICKETWERLQETAKELIEEKGGYANPTVKAHWQSIVDGVAPFGYEVEE